MFGDVIPLPEVSFTCREGEIFGIIGHNGAGKTTTLSMLSTMQKPTSGFEPFREGIFKRMKMVSEKPSG